MILIKALDELHDKVQALKKSSSSFRFPKIQVVVTGKGPQKEHYLAIFDQRNKERWDGEISIRTVWLEVDDYPKMVAAADLGVCLHFSSSGLDLPMKVVDMFSARLPCLAYYYHCIEELVIDGTNGRLFNNQEDLANQLFDTLKGGFDSDTSVLSKYKRNLRDFGQDGWDQQWAKVMLPAVIPQ